MIDFFFVSSYNDFGTRLYDVSYWDDRIYYENTQNHNVNQIDQYYQITK